LARLFVNLVRFAAAGPSVILDGALIGLVHASIFYAAWEWTKEYDLRRHLNWVISMAYIFVGDVGLVTFIGYAGAQFLGGAAAGGILSAVGAGVVPDIGAAATATSMATAYGFEFLGSLVLGFVLLYNEKLENPKEKEIENHRRAGLSLAIAIFFMTTALYQFQSYTWGNVTNAPASPGQLLSCGRALMRDRFCITGPLERRFGRMKSADRAARANRSGWRPKTDGSIFNWTNRRTLSSESRKMYRVRSMEPNRFDTMLNLQFLTFVK